MCNSGIYVIRNLINHKFYLGSAKDFNLRKGKHFKDLRANKHVNKHLQNAFNKYGEVCFEFEIIQVTENYKAVEQEYLDNLDWPNAYNISASSGGGNLMKNHPDKPGVYKKAVSTLKARPDYADIIAKRSESHRNNPDKSAYYKAAELRKTNPNYKETYKRGKETLKARPDYEDIQKRKGESVSKFYKENTMCITNKTVKRCLM
jgi:group I intron endonuclease